MAIEHFWHVQRLFHTHVGMYTKGSVKWIICYEMFGMPIIIEMVNWIGNSENSSNETCQYEEAITEILHNVMNSFLDKVWNRKIPNIFNCGQNISSMKLYHPTSKSTNKKLTRWQTNMESISTIFLSTKNIWWWHH